MTTAAALATWGAVALALKLLLAPTYFSTDFAVHRNWLALTHAEPLACWYFDRASPWTLDYPPLFAYAERALAVGLHLCGATDLLLTRGTDAVVPDADVVVAHRATVMLSDGLLLAGVVAMATAMPPPLPTRAAAPVLGALVLLSAPLLLVDHVHFQYNGMLLGVLLLAVALALRRRFVLAAALFAALVSFKHLFVVLGPVVATHLLAQFVWPSRSFANLVLLAAVLLGVTAAALAPILLATALGAPIDACAGGSPLRQLQQIGARLFPFAERGLMHAYWAPNAYALYAAADLAAARVAGRRAPGALTSGLVEASAQQFSVLPDVSPRTCAILTALAMLPLVASLVRQRAAAAHAGVAFVRAIAYASLSAFMFGWHVHEKAILVALVPLTFVAAVSDVDRQQLLLLTAAGGAGLLPLLDPARPIDRLALALLLALYWLVAYLALARLTPRTAGVWSERLLVAYGIGALLLLPAYAHIVHPLLDRGARLPFLPLLVTSVFCAVGVSAAWLRAMWQALTG
jgi:alpha-1,3-glucosyltransferase